MKNHGLTLEDAERLLEPTVSIPGIDASFERVQAITDFRKDDAEARVLFICRKKSPSNDVSDNAGEEELFVLKCKVQFVPTHPNHHIQLLTFI